MDTMTLLLILSVILLIFTSIFFWFYRKWEHPQVSPVRQTYQKGTPSPQGSLDSRTLTSSQERGRKDFAASSSPSQILLERHNTGNSRPGSSSSPYNSRYADAMPQTNTAGNRSVEYYEQCIHVSYEPAIDGISLVFTNTVITNAAEVDNVFTVCEQKFKALMRAKGWERTGWIADLGGYTLVGTEATTLVGEALKLFLDRFGLKTRGGLYLIAHYSSKAAPPDRETLNEKLKRIQFITAGVINEFQGNVFDTRDEAIAFYLRLRQELLTDN